MDEHNDAQDRREIPEPVESDTHRATGMGNPGTFSGDRGESQDTTGRNGASMGGTPVDRARRLASGRLEETADRVRHLGDRAAERNRVLERTRPLAYNAAEGIDSAAEYVRTREIDEMRTDLETQVRRHPLASVAIAFFAGYTLRRIF